MGAHGTDTDDPPLSVLPLWPASVGVRLRQFRERAGLSQEALAERARLSLSTLKALERDRRQRPHPHTLALLAEALGLAAAERADLLELAGGAPAQSTGADHPPAPAAGPPARLVRLPVPPTALIGRVNEVAEARALLEPMTGAARLLTLVGPGGVGKTRLALAVAGALVTTYADGVVFVDLAPLRDARLVPATVASTLGVREAGGRSARELLIAHLRWRPLRPRQRCSSSSSGRRQWSPNSR